MIYIKLSDMLQNMSSESKKELRNNILFCIALFFKFFIYDISIVPSSSMTPTFLTGDLVIVNKHCIRWSMLTIPWGGALGFGKKGLLIKSPERGTPCVFTIPDDPFTLYLKRMIAVAGDTVQMKNGILYINDKPVKMEFVKNLRLLNDHNKYEDGKIYKVTMKNGKSYLVYRNCSFGEGHIDNTPKYTVPKGYVWMQGDNHTGSWDCFSGFIKKTGALPEDHLISTPVFVLVNSKSRGEIKGFWSWLVALPYSILKYIWNIDFSRKFFVADQV